MAKGGTMNKDKLYDDFIEIIGNHLEPTSSEDMTIGLLTNNTSMRAWHAKWQNDITFRFHVKSLAQELMAAVSVREGDEP